MRFLFFGSMQTCRGVALGMAGSLCRSCCVVCAMAVTMSGCLDDAMSCSGVGPCGSRGNVVARTVCHLLAMEVDLGSGLERELRECVRCAGDSACKSLRKYKSTFLRVSGMWPPRCGLAHSNSWSESM